MNENKGVVAGFWIFIL